MDDPRAVARVLSRMLAANPSPAPAAPPPAAPSDSDWVAKRFAQLGETFDAVDQLFEHAFAEIEVLRGKIAALEQRLIERADGR
jgi:hypothetical protein